jgi:outer membrane protein assembly factor BamB
LYAPLFHKNDTIYVFDYYKDKLFAFDANGNAIDSIPIYHHYQPKSTGWKKNLIQDQKTGTIYAHFELDGYSYIGKINLLTGLIENKVKLAYKYVDKIAIYNNEVYFIYRPFESLQNKYLYKQVIL